MSLVSYQFLGNKKESYFFRDRGRDLKVKYNPEMAVVSIQNIGEIHPSCIKVYSSKKHVCGLKGFGISLEDSCSCCEEISANSIVLGKVRNDLIRKNLLKEKKE